MEISAFVAKWERLLGGLSGQLRKCRSPSDVVQWKQMVRSELNKSVVSQELSILSSNEFVQQIAHKHKLMEDKVNTQLLATQMEQQDIQNKLGAMQTGQLLNQEALNRFSSECQTRFQELEATIQKNRSLLRAFEAETLNKMEALTLVDLPEKEPAPQP